MVVADLLHSIGLSGSIVTIVVAVIGLKHGREVLGLLSTIGIWTKAIGFLVFLFVLSTTGLIPGVEVAVELSLGVLARLAADGFDLLSGLIRALL